MGLTWCGRASYTEKWPLRIARFRSPDHLVEVFTDECFCYLDGYDHGAHAGGLKVITTILCYRFRRDDHEGDGFHGYRHTKERVQAIADAGDYPCRIAYECIFA